ncbi:MAG: hypothetical protein RL328_2867 [Acidobacteriota bacterium]|jgi:uroporphyrin-III C-methyltransferase
MKIFVAGVSLGDPDLLTRKTERVLAAADAVLVDDGVSAQVLCLANSDAEVVTVGLGSSEEERQADVFGWYLRLMDHCQTVVRLTVADPVLAGGEEWEFLTRHGFEIEILPEVLAETVYEAREAMREAQRSLA